MNLNGVFKREREEGRKRNKAIFVFQSSDSGGFREHRRSSPQAVAMATLSLRISIPEKNATKMMQFDPSTSIYDACRIIREKLAEASNMGQRKLSSLASQIFNDVPRSNEHARICIFFSPPSLHFHPSSFIPRPFFFNRTRVDVIRILNLRD